MVVNWMMGFGKSFFEFFLAFLNNWENPTKNIETRWNVQENVENRFLTIFFYFPLQLKEEFCRNSNFSPNTHKYQTLDFKNILMFIVISINISNFWIFLVFFFEIYWLNLSVHKAQQLNTKFLWIIFSHHLNFLLLLLNPFH